jgi:predicted TIM-barrel fold metal-dependent hydrolase
VHHRVWNEEAVGFIALEEHYFDRQLADYTNAGFSMPPAVIQALEDVGPARIKELDELGIDIQVLSHCPPGLQAILGQSGVDAARMLNDNLATIVRGSSGRYAGFAALPTHLPEAAADELERCVSKLDFKGALINGLTGQSFLDERRFWPIFERASRLDVPIYIHPADPHKSVVDAYYGDYASSFPMFSWAAWGFTVEMGTQAIRLVLSGVFDKFPNLKIIMGHMGETIPYLLYRIDETLSRGQSFGFRELYLSHFYVTTSAFFSDAALRCCIDEIGVDRVMFSVDYPFASNKEAVSWLNRAPITEVERRKISTDNARKLLKL